MIFSLADKINTEKKNKFKKLDKKNKKAQLL